MTEINEGLLNLDVLNKQEYDVTLSSVTHYYEGRRETFKRKEAIRNARLSRRYQDKDRDVM